MTPTGGILINYLYYLMMLKMYSVIDKGLYVWRKNHMNKSLITRLLAAALAVSASVYANSNDTNKTFLMPRSHGVNLAMEYANWSDTLHRKGDDRFGGNVQLSWFYRASTNDTELGKYFGIRNQNPIHFRYDNAPATAAAITGPTSNPTGNYPSAVKNHLELGYLLHSPLNLGTAESIATICLKPEQTSYGFVLDYHQNLEKLLDGLYFKIAVPIVYVKNDMHVSGAYCDGGDETQAKNLLNYLNGTYENPNVQAKLENALLGCSDSETGVADVYLKLGYDFVHDECYHAGINIGLTIPTGNEPKGKKVFEAIVGNGGHFGFGAGLDGAIKIWGEDNHTLRVVAAVDYRYLFEACEKRTLSIAGACDNECVTATCKNSKPVAGEGCKTTCNPCGTRSDVAITRALDTDMTRDCGTSCDTSDSCKTTASSCCGRNWSQYYLLGKVAGANTALIPAANILTQAVDVTPGSQIDAILALNYRCCGFLVDLGYDLFYREKESVKYKGTIPAGYYVAARNYTTAGAFRAPDAAGANGDAEIPTAAAPTAINKALELSNATVSTGPAATPSQLTHKVFASLGYRFEDMDTPVTLGLGGGYEFADRKALECWEIWLKAGINF